MSTELPTNIEGHHSLIKMILGAVTAFFTWGGAVVMRKRKKNISYGEAQLELLREISQGIREANQFLSNLAQVGERQEERTTKIWEHMLTHDGHRR